MMSQEQPEACCLSAGESDDGQSQLGTLSCEKVQSKTSHLDDREILSDESN